jgi:hypothetical protein
MPKLRVHAFSISLDGYGAGPSQSTKDPLGVGGEALHEWFFPTRTFQSLRLSAARGARPCIRIRGGLCVETGRAQRAPTRAPQNTVPGYPARASSPPR